MPELGRRIRKPLSGYQQEDRAQLDQSVAVLELDRLGPQQGDIRSCFYTFRGWKIALVDHIGADLAPSLALHHAADGRIPAAQILLRQPRDAAVDDHEALTIRRERSTVRE